MQSMCLARCCVMENAGPDEASAHAEELLVCSLQAPSALLAIDGRACNHRGLQPSMVQIYRISAFRCGDGSFKGFCTESDD